MNVNQNFLYKRLNLEILNKEIEDIYHLLFEIYYNLVKIERYSTDKSETMDDFHKFFKEFVI
jgi:hypothetical protein